MSSEQPSRNVWKCVAFLAICFVGDRVGGYFMGRVFMSTRFRFAELYEGRLPADLLILGNSRGVHMFHRPPIQAITGKRVTNLSFNGMPATMLPVIYTDYIRYHEPPKRMFVEVSCLGRNNEPGSFERFRVLADRSDSFRRLQRRLAPSDCVACQISHLYRYNSELFWRSILFFRESDQDWIMKSTLDENWRQNLNPETIRRFEPSSMDIDALKELLVIADDNGTDVTLIFAPYYPDYFHLTEGSPAWLQWIERETGKTVVDYSTSLKELSLFADPIHLNPDGAERLAELMF